MKRWSYFLIVLLFSTPLALMFYKYQVLNLSLVPHMVDDVWNIHISINPKDEVQSISFPVPRNGFEVKIPEEKYRLKNFKFLVDNNSDSAVITWISSTPFSQSVTYSARVDIQPIVIKKIPKDETTVYPKQLKKYLKTPELTPEEEELFKTLESAILEGHEDKTSLARKVFYYVHEEIQRNVKYKTIVDAINNGKGSPLIKAKIYSKLLRRHQIPTRIIAMIRLTNTQNQVEQKHRITFANEVFLNNRWIPVDTNRGHFGERPDNYLVLHHHYDEIEKTISKKNLSYVFSAQKSVINKFNRQEYGKDLLKRNTFINLFSFYRLPLPTQSMFSFLLLIPIGTLILSFARNMVGIPTFGMFTPILLTMFFKETNLIFGIGFFAFVVLIGIFERYVLDKLYLLAVPRLSILLTLVIIFLMVFSFTGLDQKFSSEIHLGFFPIVIVTSFIERFSIMMTEEGLKNTLKTLFGTLAISIMSYSLYSITWLEILLFTNPEILLIVIGLLILIGKYKGYRISEFLRFRDLIQQVKNRAKR